MSRRSVKKSDGKPANATAKKIKRLVKKADHDVMNRDAAILYINEEFYIDVTHAACLEQYIRNHGSDIELSSYQYRPEIETFVEISENVGPVIVGHQVNREDAVYIIYGVFDGAVDYFDDIPEVYIKDFEDKFGVEVKDEMKHPSNAKNPYEDDSDEIWQNTKERIMELSGHGEILNNAKDYLQQNGFENKGSYWFDGFTFVKIGGMNDFDKDKSVRCKIVSVGNWTKTCYLEELIDKMGEIDNSAKNVLSSMNNLNIEDIAFGEVEYNFNNTNGVYFEISFLNNEIVLNDVSDMDFFDFCDLLNDSNDLNIEDLQFIQNFNGGN